MTLRRRVIVCLDVRDGRVVKGVHFEDLRDVGNPVELAARYEREGADEIVFLDISASAEGRRTLLDTVRRTAERLSIPLTVGGGIREVGDVERALRAGADKVCVNTAAVTHPQVIADAAARFGSQCVVASIDARAEPGDGDGGARFRVFTHGGRRPTGLDAVEWAGNCAERGAGEILITSIDRDGERSGYDLEVTARVVEAVRVPVVASGGAGAAEHLCDAFLTADAAAALAAGIFHDGVTTVAEVKRVLHASGIPVRLPEPALLLGAGA